MNMKPKLLSGVSMIALAAACLPLAFAQTNPTATAPAGANAQTGTPEVVKMSTYVVTGTRASLASAQEIKMDSGQIVDSIVSSDIDKLPDMNVAEALMRITGVQIALTAGEVGGNAQLSIRGLTQVENTIDGREIFTAGGSGSGIANGKRTYNYQDLPSALVGGIDVYKTSAANQPEGGLGGLIDVRMRKPFDVPGQMGVVTVGTTYNSVKRDDKPNYDLVYSNTWKTSAGKFGILVSGAYQVLPWREDQLSTGNPTASTTLVSGSTVYFPNGYNAITSLGVHTRTGANTVVQWAPNQNLELYAGCNYQDFWVKQTSYQISVGVSAATAVAGSGATFNGTDVKSATFANVTGSVFGLIRNTTDRERQIYAGGKYTSGDLTVKFDASRTDSHYNFINNGVFSSAAIPEFSYQLGGAIPSGQISGASLTDTGIYKYTQAYNRLYPANGGENEFRVDADYKLSGGFFSSILAGIRYANTQSDNYPHGLYLGSYNIPAGSQAYGTFPGQYVVNPAQNFFDGYKQANLVQYLSPNPGIMQNAQQLLTTYGDTTTTATNDGTVNPLSLFNIKETNTALYLMPKFSGNAGGFLFDGNVGVRMVNTKENLKGFQTVTPAAISPTGVAILGPLDISHSYTDFLPSFNMRIHLTDNTILRLAASKSLTRPDFSQLSPSLTLNANPITPSLNAGAAGNPNLNPIRSNNYDISLEKYFSKSTSVYVAGFLKEVTGFPVTLGTTETYNGLSYLVNRPYNLNTGKVKGGEIGYQQFFDFLPAPFDGLGFQGNFTYVDSNTPSTIVGVSAPLQSLSRDSYNAILMYEKGPVSMRLAYNWRSKYFNQYTALAGLGNLPQFTKKYGMLDASFNYAVTKNLSINLQAQNITNTLRETYWTVATRPLAFFVDGAFYSASVTLHL